MENILNYIVKYRNRLIFIKKKNDIFFTGNEKKNKKEAKKCKFLSRTSSKEEDMSDGY